jgi:hypothetical protein
VQPSALGQVLTDPVTPTKIYYVKAAVDYKALKEQANAFQNDKKPICRGTDDVDGATPCGLLSFMRTTEATRAARRYVGHPDFPMSSTIWITADSNQEHYNAYRDLGWYLFGFICRSTELSSSEICQKTTVH